MLRRTLFSRAPTTVNTPPRTQVKGPTSSEMKNDKKRKLALDSASKEPINWKFIFGVSGLSLTGLFYCDPEPFFVFYLAYIKGINDSETFESELKKMMKKA